VVKKVDPPKKGGASAPSVTVNVTGGASAPSSTDPKKLKRTWLADLPEIVAKWAWSNRWHLTPFLVTAWVGFAGQVSGALVGAVTTAVVATVLYAMRNRAIRGRMYLSEKEREIAALYLVIASLWQAAAMLSPLHPAAELIVLVLAVAYPTYRWSRSRKKPAKKKITRKSAEWLARWNDRISTPRPGVPDALKGSRPLRATAVEPAADSLTFVLQLRDGVHGSDAATDVCRKAVEATLGLPAECVLIERVRENSTQARVTMTAGRHLEANTVDWPGPQISKEGVLKVGDTPDGKDVEIRRWDKDGVKHGRISGNTGNGKSSTVRVVMTPGVDQGREVIWFIDGKRGTSIPELRPAIDWYAIRDEEWGKVIDALVAVMNARQLRRGEAGKSFWRTWEEEEPNITLLIEESSVVRRVLNGGKSGGTMSKWDGKVLDLLQQGRALGIAVVQVSQDSMADNLLGGRQARELMAAGFNIMHKPGGKMGQTLARDSVEEKVNLLALPNEPGFAAVTYGGKPVAEVCRIAHATDEAARAWAESVKDDIRTLTGDDLVAAGANYARRGIPTPAESEPVMTTAAAGLPPIPVEDDDEVEQTEAELSATQAWLLKVLGIYGPKTLGELEELGKGARGRKRRNISNNLAELARAEKVRQESGRWVLFGSDVDTEVDGR
jgi:hypothetical protein